MILVSPDLWPQAQAVEEGSVINLININNIQK